ncbi:hypothetical protein V6N12_067848 [Hibiscus sabdariffa]|uniref:Uncharacterized protein n=1 Tax=Hibiscus sabdariffa TaxID=183260 RepID=A0ABR2FN88_9ROSI
MESLVLDSEKVSITGRQRETEFRLAPRGNPSRCLFPTLSPSLVLSKYMGLFCIVDFRFLTDDVATPLCELPLESRRK